jgi:PAS domain-containing protein
MNGNGYPYPMRSFPSSRQNMLENMENMENMENDMGGFEDMNQMNQGQSLDQASLHDDMNQFLDNDSGQIVSQNDKVENIRRRSMPVYTNNNRTQPMPMEMSPESRRLSMLNFGDPSDAGDFQFDMQAAGMEDMMRNNPSFSRSSADMQHDHNRNPANNMASLNTQFQGQNSPFSTMAAPGSTYASPLHPNSQLDLGMSPYPNGLNMSMDMDDSLNMMSNDMNMFPNNQFNTPMMDSPVAQEFIGPMPAPNQDNSMSTIPHDHFKRPSMSNTPEARTTSGMGSRTTSHDHASMRSNSRPHSEQHSSSKSNVPTQMSLASLKKQQPVALDPRQDLPEEKMHQIDDFKLPWNPPAGGFPSTMHSNPHMKTQFKDAYSSTGFDMLGVLMRVATRPDPQIDIGSVDLSCAFVVCDAEMDDIPIVYCSDNFERLTGYTRHMILGRNCRFLQSPDGKVEAGIKRKYVDDDSVLYLKNMINTRAEAQISLINYRRGGQPFMNLLTMIPIAWEQGGPMKFFVGFQVDLVEQPGAMTNKNSGKLILLEFSEREANVLQTVRTESTTSAAWACRAMSSTMGRSHSRSKDRRYPRTRSRTCWRPTAAPETQKSPDGYGTRSCWRIPTMSFMSCLSKASSSTYRLQVVASWSMTLAS